MSVFDAKYYSDAEVWLFINGIIDKYHELQKHMAQPEISTDPNIMPELAKQLNELGIFLTWVNELKDILQDVDELKELLAEEEQSDLEQLYTISLNQQHERARQIYLWLLDNGYLGDEIEDKLDLKILQFIDYAGPEYAWRLGINIGIDVQEARNRLQKLLEKGLLERVEGNMLGNYHREKSWTKHMNHTYYRISRQGKLYVRKLRREDDDPS